MASSSQRAQEKCARGNHVARGAPKELLRRGRFAAEACHLQAANHHSGRGSAENREEAEVLDVYEGEGGKADGRAELAEGELAAQRTKEGKEAAVGKGQARGADHCGSA